MSDDLAFARQRAELRKGMQAACSAVTLLLQVEDFSDLDSMYEIEEILAERPIHTAWAAAMMMAKMYQPAPENWPKIAAYFTEGPWLQRDP